MAYRMVWFPLKLLLWGLGIVGAAALVLTAMLATPLARLPELTSVSQAARAVDRSTMPPLERFYARDGTELAYRHYPARGPVSEKIAVLVHGSSGSSVAVHALGGFAFLLWMAAVNGGGLLLGGLWMRRS
jgi:hypothetical protein